MNLAYLVGLIDGEGCIGFTKIRGKIIPRLTITNTNFEIIQEIKNCFGGYILKASHIKINWKPAFHWVLCNAKCINLLDKVFKYLKIKYQQAICLFCHSVIKPGKGKHWSNEGLEACDLLLNQIHWLNKKGIHNDLEPMIIAYSEARKGKKRSAKKK